MKIRIYRDLTLCVATILSILFFSSCETDYKGKIDAALAKKDFEKAHEVLDKMKADQLYQEKDLSWLNNTDEKNGYGVATYRKYANKILQSEINYLIYQSDSQAADRLIALLSEYAEVGFPITGVTNSADVIEKNEQYAAQVGRFNGICDDVLSRAISNGNYYLAERVIRCYRPTLTRETVQSHFIEKDEYEYRFVETDRDRAEQRLKEAIAKGRFDGISQVQSTISSSIEPQLDSQSVARYSFYLKDDSVIKVNNSTKQEEVMEICPYITSVHPYGDKTFFIGDQGFAGMGGFENILIGYLDALTGDWHRLQECYSAEFEPNGIKITEISEIKNQDGPTCDWEPVTKNKTISYNDFQ